MSDFSLMDAIECGIVKLPRVPVADNIPGDEMPMFRNLWENIRQGHAEEGPRQGRGRSIRSSFPPQLQTALEALYGHYEKTFKLWEEAGIQVPPCFIIVCKNTSISKLVYDYISGFHRENEDGTTTLENGRLALFRNFDEHGNPLAAPEHAADRQRATRSPATRWTTTSAAWPPTRSSASAARSSSAPATLAQAENITDQELLREVMNTVGKPGQLGGSTSAASSPSRCSPKAGMPTPSPTSSASAPSAPSFCASRSSAAPCAASPTT